MWENFSLFLWMVAVWPARGPPAESKDELKHRPSDSEHSQPHLQEHTLLTCSAQHLGPPLAGLCFSSRPLSLDISQMMQFPRTDCMKEKMVQGTCPVYTGQVQKAFVWPWTSDSLDKERNSMLKKLSCRSIHWEGSGTERSSPFADPVKRGAQHLLDTAPIWGANYFQWDYVKKVGIWPKSPRSHPRRDSRVDVGGGSVDGAFTPGCLQGSVNHPKALLSRLAGAERGCRALEGGTEDGEVLGSGPRLSSAHPVGNPFHLSAFSLFLFPVPCLPGGPQTSDNHLFCLTFHTHQMKTVV